MAAKRQKIITINRFKAAHQLGYRFPLLAGFSRLALVGRFEVVIGYA